jgi:hypothetical protein
VVGLGLLLVGTTVDVLDAAAFEAGDEAGEAKHVEHLVLQATARRFPEEKESAPGVEGACLRVDGFGRTDDTYLGSELGGGIAGEHAHAPESEAVVSPKSELLDLHEGRGDVRAREQEERALGGSRPF